MSRPPAFTEAATRTLGLCDQIITDRHGEYQDSWSLENLATPLLDHMALNFQGGTTSPEFKRLIVIACMIDVKLSRLAGPFKIDTIVDLINYLAAWADWMDEYEKGRIDGPTKRERSA